MEIIPSLQNKYLHQKRPKPVLKLTRVEVVVVEIFSIQYEWMVTTSSYNQLAIILQF
ncbi:MAG: hypothetical protein M3136_05815 [Thermoproteota archaeon]|nr:hypothetical protein [Thermoproteota archaeon]